MSAGSRVALSGGQATREYSIHEIFADAVLHAAGIALALIGTSVLVVLAAGDGIKGTTVAAVYSVTLLTMLGCSAAYNVARSTRIECQLRRLDQSAIFLMIAGTYTPVAVLGLGGPGGVAMTVAVWSAALSCILLRLWWPDFFQRCGVVPYLMLGWIGVVGIGPLIHAVGGSVVILLALGGILYTIGVVFHLWRRLPFQNVIWHGFVLAAASVHFFAVTASVVAS